MMLPLYSLLYPIASNIGAPKKTDISSVIAETPNIYKTNLACTNSIPPISWMNGSLKM